MTILMNRDQALELLRSWLTEEDDGEERASFGLLLQDLAEARVDTGAHPLRGKYAFVPTSTEQFLRRKRKEAGT